MTSVLRWPMKISREIFSLAIHGNETICMVGQAPDQIHDPLSFSIWITDHLAPGTSRESTGWKREFAVILTGESAPEGFDVWRGSWSNGSYVFHLFEKDVFRD